MRARLPHLAIAACLCAFALAPLGYPGYTQPQTGFTPVYALYDWEAVGLSLAWSPASSDVYWGPLSGDGLLPYALAEACRYAGGTGTEAIRFVFALALVLGAVGACALFAAQTHPLIAIAFAVTWAYSPMSLGAVYARGQLGAALALGLLPWLALAMQAPGEPSLAATTGGRWWRAASGLLRVLTGAAIGLSHLGFALMSLATLAALGRARRRLLPSVGVALAALWAVSQAGSGGLVPGRTPPAQLAMPYQLLTSAFGYGASSLPWAAEAPAPLSFGLVPLALTVFAAAFARPRNGRAWLRPALVVLLLTGMATTAAAPLWQEGWLSALLAGPWQLIALAAFVLIATLAAPLGAVAGRQSEVVAIVLLLVALTAAVPALESVPVTALTPASAPLASFDDGRIVLVAAELHGPLRHGATPRLRLYWQAREPLDRDYTVFIHVLDDAGTKWGQRDSQPADRDAPTTTWRPGALVVDEHPVYVDVNGPTEVYHIVLGLYDLDTGQRLPLENGASALELSYE